MTYIRPPDNLVYTCYCKKDLQRAARAAAGLVPSQIGNENLGWRARVLVRDSVLGDGTISVQGEEQSIIRGWTDRREQD